MPNLQMSDSTASWHMQPDGTYIHHSRDDEGRPLVDSQEISSASTSAARAPTTDMAPGRAPDKASGTSLVHRIFRKTSGARGTVGA